jgi:hypothetical protein
MAGKEKATKKPTAAVEVAPLIEDFTHKGQSWDDITGWFTAFHRTFRAWSKGATRYEKDEAETRNSDTIHTDIDVDLNCISRSDIDEMVDYLEGQDRAIGFVGADECERARETLKGFTTETGELPRAHIEEIFETLKRFAAESPWSRAIISEAAKELLK